MLERGQNNVKHPLETAVKVAETLCRVATAADGYD
jgi:hypothetical protein